LDDFNYNQKFKKRIITQLISLIASNKNDLGKLKGLLVHPFQSKQTPQIFTVKGYAYAMGYFAGQIDQKAPRI